MISRKQRNRMMPVKWNAYLLHAHRLAVKQLAPEYLAVPSYIYFHTISFCHDA